MAVDNSLTPRPWTVGHQKREREELKRELERRSNQRNTATSTIESGGKVILAGGIDVVEGGNITLLDNGMVQMYGEGINPLYQPVAVTTMLQNRLRTHPWTGAQYLSPAVWFNQGSSPDALDAHVGSVYGKDVEVVSSTEDTKYNHVGSGNKERSTLTAAPETWGVNVIAWNSITNPLGPGSGGAELGSAGFSCSTADLWCITSDNVTGKFAWVNLTASTGTMELKADGGVNVVGQLTENGKDVVVYQDPYILYVNPSTGNDANAGTSSGSPLATVGRAFEIIEAEAQLADSEWIVNLAGATYTERVRCADYTPFSYSVTVQGPAAGHPNVPTALFTEGTDVSAIAFLVSNPLAVVTVKDVRFSGYRGTASSGGLACNDGRLFCVNVHTDNCYYGISGLRAELDVKGGIFTTNGYLAAGGGNGAAIRSLFQTHHSIGLQNAGNNTNGPEFHDNVTGIFAQEFSTGHADWCTFEDNSIGIQLNVNSRCNADGSHFERNAVDMSARGNSNFNTSNCTYGTGADRSGEQAAAGQGSVAARIDEIDVDTSYRRVAGVFWAEYDTQTVTGTTSTVDLANHTLGAQAWGGTPPVSTNAGKRLSYRVTGEITGTAGVKRMHVRLGSALAGVTLSATETGKFIFDAELVFAGPGKQFLACTFTRHLGSSTRVDHTTSAVDMESSQAAKVTCSLDNAADSITVSRVEATIYG